METVSTGLFRVSAPAADSAPLGTTSREEFVSQEKGWRNSSLREVETQICQCWETRWRKNQQDACLSWEQSWSTARSGHWECSGGWEKNMNEAKGSWVWSKAVQNAASPFTFTKLSWTSFNSRLKKRSSEFVLSVLVGVENKKAGGTEVNWLTYLPKQHLKREVWGSLAFGETTGHNSLHLIKHLLCQIHSKGLSKSSQSKEMIGIYRRSNKSQIATSLYFQKRSKCTILNNFTHNEKQPNLYLNKFILISTLSFTRLRKK